MVPMAMSAEDIQTAANLLNLLKQLENVVKALDLDKKAVLCEFRVLTSDYDDKNTWTDHSLKLGVEIMRTMAYLAVDTARRQLKDMGVEVAG